MTRYPPGNMVQRPQPGSETIVPDCSWCGAECDQPRPFLNWKGEVFCSPGHRSASNRAWARLSGETAPKRAPHPRTRRNPAPRPTAREKRRTAGVVRIIEEAKRTGDPYTVDLAARMIGHWEKDTGRPWVEPKPKRPATAKKTLVITTYSMDFTSQNQHAQDSYGRWWRRFQEKDPRYGYKWGKWKPGAKPDKTTGTMMAVRLPKEYDPG